MPINLAEYTPRIKDSLKRGGFACVFVISTPDGKPSKVSYAVNLWNAVAEFQRSCPTAIWVEEILWVPDRAIATAIAKATQGNFAHKLLHGGWVDDSAEKVIAEMNMRAFGMYPGATMMTHRQLVAEAKTRKPDQERAAEIISS